MQWKITEIHVVTKIQNLTIIWTMTTTKMKKSTETRPFQLGAASTPYHDWG